MLIPVGLRVTLFDKDFRLVESAKVASEGLKHFYGKKMPKSVGRNILECQPTSKEDPSGEVFKGSIRISKEGPGKVTGYWTGITATEAQTFTYTVGVSSEDSASTTSENVKKLSSAAE